MSNVRRSTRPLHILPCARCLQLILLGMLVASSVALGADTRPNILLIYTDDQSHRSVSCYPEAWEWVRTPNIDRLASRGVRFAHAFIGTWCMPSRATLLTGHHPFGVRSMRMAGQSPGSTYDPAECPFWPKVFRSEGYTTAQVGKWHTGTDTGAGRDWDWQAVWNRPRYPENSGHYLNGTPWYVSLRRGSFKYIRTLVQNEIEELYDIDTDPEELTNLALDPSYRSRLRRLRADTLAEMRRTQWELVDYLPGVREAQH